MRARTIAWWHACGACGHRPTSTCKDAYGRATSTDTRATSGTTEQTSSHDAGRGAPQRTDATELDLMEVDYMDKETREQGGQSLMAPSGTEVGV